MGIVWWLDPKLMFYKRITGLFHHRFMEHKLSNPLEIFWNDL